MLKAVTTEAEVNIFQVQPKDLSIVWPRVKHHLQRVVDESHGDLCMKSIRAGLLKGEGQLLAITRGEYILAAATMNVQTMDSGKRVLVVPAVGGDEIENWIEALDEYVTQVAKNLMCDSVRGIGRLGWVRKLKDYGWTPCHQIVEKEV